MQSQFPRLVTAALGVYAGAALALAAIGIFGVVSYSVSRRTAEIGVRMALGARPADVVQLILRQGAAPIAAGIASGLCLATWLSRYLKTQLYAVSPLDAGVYAGVSFLLAAVAIAACLGPAVRAANVDPATALRCE